MTQAMTHYDVLEIERSATTSEVRQAFKKLALVYHPDKRPEAERAEAANLFKSLKTAYEVLCDPDSRKHYDLRIGVASAGTQQATRNSTAAKQPSQAKAEPSNFRTSEPSNHRSGGTAEPKTKPSFSSTKSSFPTPAAGYPKSSTGSESRNEWDRRKASQKTTAKASTPSAGYPKFAPPSESKEWERQKASETAAATEQKAKAKAKANVAAVERRKIDESLRSELRVGGVEYQDRLEEYFKKINKAPRSNSTGTDAPKSAPEDAAASKSASGASQKEAKKDSKEEDASCVIS